MMHPHFYIAKEKPMKAGRVTVVFGKLGSANQYLELSRSKKGLVGYSTYQTTGSTTGPRLGSIEEHDLAAFVAKLLRHEQPNDILNWMLEVIRSAKLVAWECTDPGRPCRIRAKNSKGLKRLARYCIQRRFDGLR